MISSKKISDGVHFRFSDNSHYATFLKTLDVLIREDAKTYLFYDKDIWFINLHRIQLVKQLNCLCLFVVWNMSR